MEIAAPADVKRISDKAAAAVRSNPGWLEKYALKKGDARPLPYHPNFGVTAKEYARLLSGLNQLALQDRGIVELRVEARPDGGLALLPTAPASPLAGIVIYPARNFVQTAYGRLEQRSDIDQSDATAATGPWKGVQWKLERVSDRTAVKFAIGKRKAGDSIIYYDVINPASRERHTVILLYGG